MNMILAHVFFCFAVLTYITAMLQKNRKTFLIVVIVCDLFWVLYYLFLDRYTPTILNAAEALLNVGLFFFEKYNKSRKWVLSAVGITWAVYITATILTWTGPLQLLSFFASSMFLLGLAVDRLVFTKIFHICSVSAATIYWFCVASIFTGCVGICMWIGTVVGFVRSLLFELNKRKLRAEHAKTVEQKSVVKKPIPLIEENILNKKTA